MANRTTAVLLQARSALQKNRTQLQQELDSIDRALAALKGVEGRRVSSAARRSIPRKRVSPKVLAALKRARAARKRKRLGKATQPAAN